MNKVYIVTSGEYSDYHIDAVFVSLEKAKAYTRGGAFYNIESWTIGDEFLDLYWWTIVSADCSSALEIKDINVDTSIENGVDVEREHMRTKFTWFSSYEDLTFRLMMIFPKSRFVDEYKAKDHCVKVMQDYVAKVKYMVQVEGISVKKAADLINDQLF